MSFVPAPEAKLGGKYRLVRPLATGGMGTVWLAHHESLAVDVAVKFMSPLLEGTPAVGRFEREARASAQLKSPHLVEVFDYGLEAGTPFMVMERLLGEDLGARIADRSRLTLAETSRVTRQIAKALTVVHAAGIVHRDLKPSNVFLAQEAGEEVVKLLDFGVARDLGGPADERTQSGVIVGSAHHMSPEQAQAQAVDHRSDLWSLGVVVYRALTGRRPFEGDGVTAVMIAVVTKPYARATEVCPDLPSAIDRFFERALARDVNGRFHDATTMADALDAIASGSDMAPWTPTAPKERRGRDEPTLDERMPSPGTSLTAAASSAAEPGDVGAAGRGAVRGVSVVALVLLASFGSFWLGHGRGPSAAGPSSPAIPPTASVSASVTAATPLATSTPAPEADASAAVSSPAASAPAPRSASTSHAPRHGRPKPKIDPFTGLPIPP